MNGPPVFVGGLMRSGTTLLRAMLGRHPDIFAGLETHWFELDFAAGRARRGEPLTDYLERLARFFDLPWPDVSRLAEASASAESFLQGFLDLAATRAGKRRWAEKTPGNVRHVDRIVAAWPDARIIHIVRDPRDVFASFRRSRKYGGPADYGRLWVETFAAVEQARQAPGGAARNLFEVRYERLVQEPEAAMAEVLDFIGAPFATEAARFDGQPEDYERVRSLTGHGSTPLEGLRQPLNGERIGVWREQLSEADVATARAVADEAGLGARFRALELAEAAAP